MIPESWRQIDNFDYEISNRGRVRRTTDENNTWAGRVLKAKTDKDGYQIVSLCKNGKQYDRKVHRLVCFAFNGPPSDPNLKARHMDGIPSHNVPSNLKWGTPKQNAEDRSRHMKTPKGEDHCRALFSDAVVITMRQDYEMAKARAAETGRKYVPRGFIDRLAAKHSVDRSTLHRILSGAGYAAASLR